MSSDLLTTEIGDPAPQARTRQWRVRAAGLVAVTLLTVGAVLWQGRTPANDAIEQSRPVTAAALEQQYGVRLGVLGLLASGGLVEIKFQVTDADKATALFGAAEDMPVLAVQGTDRVLRSARGMKHNMELHSGATYFFLYTNVANVLHAGSEVAFVINGVRIPDLVVQQ